jgi:hypothetical protein
MAFIDAPEFDDAADKKSDGSHPRFFRESRPNPARTAADGVPRFDDVEMVQILIPGDRLNSPVKLVTEAERRRWPKAYAHFKSGDDDAVEGTPIAQLPAMTAAQAEELRYFHVRSIEQLAEMPEALLKKARPMDGAALQERARRWVNATAGNAADEKLAAENRLKDEKIGLMEAQIADLKKALDGLQAQAALGQGVGQLPALET